MTKRGAALWIGAGVAVAVLAVLFAWVLFVPGPDWLARHDIGHATGTSLETARNNARGNLLALTAGIAGFGALIFTARNFALQRRALAIAEEAQRRTYELTEQGQVTERYTKAIEQLGAAKLDIRIGGIYALERIARDSARDHPTVMEVLITFVREHAAASEIPDRGSAASAPRIRADMQAALSVIGRRTKIRDIRAVKLTRADLTGADLTDADLTDADLTRATLTDSDLVRADLTGADLKAANLKGANLASADLTGADLTGADLTGADLKAANLKGANLASADLTGADLTGADLTGADLTFAGLTRATLTDADLTGAAVTHAALTPAGLSDRDLYGVRRAMSHMPRGWRVRKDGRIERIPVGEDA